MPLGSAFLTQKFIIFTAKVDENPESLVKVPSTELSDFHLQKFPNCRVESCGNPFGCPEFELE